MFLLSLPEVFANMDYYFIFIIHYIQINRNQHSGYVDRKICNTLHLHLEAFEFILCSVLCVWIAVDYSKMTNNNIRENNDLYRIMASSNTSYWFINSKLLRTYLSICSRSLYHYWS